MIVDLNLNGKQVVVVGAGREASRKVESLLVGDCEVIVIAEKASDAIRRWADEKRITLRLARLTDCECLKEFDRLILVMAVTNDSQLNRSISAKAGEMGCYVYSVDDPSHSDFSYPATVSFYDTIQVAVSTGGRSPLIAGKIRETIEPVLKNLIGREDALQARLQEKMREVAKQKLGTPGARKKFLYEIFSDLEIRRLLSQEKLSEAEALALKKLEYFHV